ncbi:hypothetical protein TRFO_37375 [Tritrichomonas foetus]|uniref:Uncharacterized protein n=1 Tax=Tritrichomonas foetus TaxID=1144522 RepID=A0A1J4JCQ9_9EUKA|nr:hypothetical protein TRFO_37375 [Tritrichomonas foetus]|eukprot:OHS96457.1 hypothetical protein TRFO_37375 [Tritrichomonas foetus]
MPPIKDFQEVHQTFQTALSKSAKARDINAAIKLLDSLQSTDLSIDEAKEVVDDLDQCFVVPNFIKTEKGKKFLSSIVLISIDRLKDLGRIIRDTFRLKTAFPSQLGDVVLNAWNTANINERSIIQTTVLKDIIECAILAAKPYISKNCRLFMEPFHAKRRRKELSVTLVQVYQPVIFRYLHSANPVVRLNALLIFGSAFPLQSSQFTAEKNSQLLEEQINELHQSLADESPKVRASAAKSVCRILYQWWEIFNNQTRTDFINYLTDELCFDSSSSSVRTAVVEGIDYLLGRYESVDYILPHLPKMGYLLHDPVESVRIQFVRLLTTVNPIKNLNIFTIVHIDHLIYRLKVDTTRSATAVCQLLQPSLFPPPSNKGKERTCNTRRVARCIFLMERNLDAAEKFYSILPKFVSTDEILCFLRFAYYWAEQTVKGRPPKLPTMKLVGNEKLVLPEFQGENDLERLDYKPHQAIWVIISCLTGYLSRKAKSDINELKEQTFPNFNSRKVIEYLPSGLHYALFNFLSYFNPTDDDIELAIEYMSSDDNEAWSEALRCLVKWKALDSFLPKMIRIIELAGKDDEEEDGEKDIGGKLSRAIKCISFIFSNTELRKVVIDDIDNIKLLSEGLTKFLTMLLIKLNIDFEGSEEIDDDTKNTAEILPDVCFTQALELIIALRVHLSIQLLKEDDEESFKSFIDVINTSIFTPIARGILSIYGPDDLQGDNLCYKVLVTLLTLVADMMALHIFDEEKFYVLLGTYTDCIDSDNGYGDDVKKVAFECLSKIVLSVAVDIAPGDDLVHPAKPIISQMVNNANSKDTINIVRNLVDSLVKTQLKKRCMPWLKDSLGDLFMADELEEEGDKTNEEEEEETDQVSAKALRATITDAILKLSEKD